MLLASGNMTRFLCFLTFYFSHAEAFPAKDTAGIVTKKDVFMSRSWGAGGMPYNGMALNKGHRTRKLDLPRVEEKFETREENFGQPSLQYLTAPEGILHDIEPSRKHSIIPQLFVSYGWGPLGK